MIGPTSSKIDRKEEEEKNCKALKLQVNKVWAQNIVIDFEEKKQKMDQILALFWTILRKELKSEIDWTQSKKHHLRNDIQQIISCLQYYLQLKLHRSSFHCGGFVSNQYNKGRGDICLSFLFTNFFLTLGEVGERWTGVKTARRYRKESQMNHI